MDDFTLQCYISLCYHMNFTSAAQATYVSQPTMTRLIASLESEVGCKLVKRGSNGLTITPAGQEFLKGAKEILRTKRDVISTVQSVNHKYADEIKIGYMAQVAYDLMPLFLKEFYENVSGIRLRLEPDRHYELVKDLLGDKIELAVISTFKYVSTDFKGNLLNKDFEACTLFDTPIVLAINENHPLAYKNYLTREEMKQEELLFYEPYDSILERDPNKIGPIMSYFSKYHEFDAEIYRTVGDLFSLLSLVECNAGIGVVPSDMMRFFSPRVKFLPVHFEDGKECSLQCVVCYKKDHNNPLITKVVEFFKSMDLKSIIPRIP